MTLEQRLRSMLCQRAEGVRPSQDAWDRIVERSGPVDRAGRAWTGGDRA